MADGAALSGPGTDELAAATHISGDDAAGGALDAAGAGGDGGGSGAPVAAGGAPPFAPAGQDVFGGGIGLLHLDRLLAGNRTRIMHPRPEQGPGPAAQGAADGSPSADAAAAAQGPGSQRQWGDRPIGALQSEGQQQQQQPDGSRSAAGPTGGHGGSGADGARPGSVPVASTSAPAAEKRQQQQRPAAGFARTPRAPRAPPGPSAPRPHPFHLRPRHVKTNYKCPAADGWRLHAVRTQRLQDPQGPTGPVRNHPVILCPGLGSSGAYCFDLSPAVSLADFLAERGWDVWTVELRGNGQSDKPSLRGGRSRWWTIDTHVEKDVPALLRFVLHETKAPQAHFLGHSMGGMVLCGVMARVDTTTAKIRSCVALGSGLFLEDSWWGLFRRLLPLSRFMWTVPSGSLLRRYSRIMLGPYRIPYIDMLYFYPSNVDPRIARMLMSRNFSDISVGVIRQIATAFGPSGLTSADGRVVYAEPSRLGRVTAPTLFMVGDTDRMCPPGGARKTWEMFGSRDKRFVCMGPASGFDSHYGHFDPLVGKKAAAEVFPVIAEFLEHHDTRTPVAKL